MIDISAIQTALNDFGIDGWLLYDFRGSNVLAQRVLGLAPSEVGSRRYAYCIPARGEPRKLVHRIEEGALSALPGSKTVYLRWQEFEKGLGHLVSGLKRVAMEYSPDNAIPYVSRVDAGTIELVKKLGVEIISSGDLIQVFEAAWDGEQEKSHFDAAVQTDAAYTRAWRFIAEAVRRARPSTKSPFRLKSSSISPRTTWRPNTRRSSRSDRTRGTRITRRRVDPTAKSTRGISCSSICGPSSSGRARFTAT